jgi:nickel-dependent lactate racemase
MSDPTSLAGTGLREGYLSPQQIAAIARDGLGALPLDGRRVLVLIPDRTRTMPMAMMFDALQRELTPRVGALDFLVALGTHPPLDDAQLTRLVGRPVTGGRCQGHWIFNHAWNEPSALVEIGSIPAREIDTLTAGRLRHDVPVALNRLVLEYDHILVCGPVFPHEVAGFSGGAKYLFPGIAAPEIIHFTHWLGALITSYSVIGRAETPVRAVIDRAAALLDTPVSLLAAVVTHEGVAGMYCGDLHQAWRRAAALSAHRHVKWVDKPFTRVLSVMPAMYDDLWTAAKGMYKMEPVVADGGEVIIYAPHVRDVSVVHGALIDQIGYHCRDYFLAQWERFAHVPGGILAHSTHVKGLGTFEPERRIESARITVTLATGIPEERCARINLGYAAPDTIDPRDWPAEPDGDDLLVPRAGELLFRVGAPPVLAGI